MTNLEAAIWAREGRQEGREVRFLCPGHDDHHPSARWNPEKEAWYCHACHAGGGFRDLAKRLGVEAQGHSNKRAQRPSVSSDRPQNFDWRPTAGKLEDHAQGHWLRAQRVLGAAKGLDISPWSENDLDTAWGAIWRAFKDVDRSDFLEDLACSIRCRGLSEEQHRHAPGRYESHKAG
ncbi:MAG: hypothetical protein IH977_03755 [Nitrospinae bacterium]|nr:hypothetical protein [Nitrospinota bacterium]